LIYLQKGRTNLMPDTMPLAEAENALAEIATRVNACTACDLHKGRGKGVPGAGPANADIMFIGEGPGQNEDKQGLPFVGQSGKFLEEMLALIGLARSQVFIGNVVKCRPPENRDPLPLEVDTCTKAYLYRQIEIINPKLIVTLGRFSMGLFFANAKITAIHGQPKWEDTRAYLPLFHPAAILRDLSKKPLMVEDFKKIPGLLEEAKKLRAAKAPPPPPSTPDQGGKPKQIELF
jgi:uracil-DNA glycosylase